MKQLLFVWGTFIAAIGVVFAAMFWLSATALRLDRGEAETVRRSAVEQNVNLALWRIDSFLTTLLAQETVRQVHHDWSGDRAAVDVSGSEGEFFVKLRFRFPADAGQATEEQLAYGLAYEYGSDGNGSGGYGEPPTRSQVPRAELASRLPEPVTVEPAVAQWNVNVPSHLTDAGELSPPPRASSEFGRRSQSVLSNSAIGNRLAAQQLQLPPPSPAVAESDPVPLWIGDELYFGRQIARGGLRYVEAAQLDWPSLRTRLLEEIEDLLPHAALHPTGTEDNAATSRLSAALPIKLAPGPLPASLGSTESTVPRTLRIAWAAVIAASLAGAWLVGGMLRLSRRRTAFVAAVTHELRTPLTTFRMYTEMLSQGMVTDPEARREYLRTLQDQSLRLSHLVENVLAFARLERGRGMNPPREYRLRELVEPLVGRLQQPAEAAGMRLFVESSPEFDWIVLADASVVEQILINLVDNSCKYAASADDRRIVISAESAGRHVALRIRDFGPGLPRATRRLRPFGRSAEEAAHSAPGIGLGLALSRRLARQMGGRLDADAAVNNGAALLLKLRRGSVGKPAARVELASDSFLRQKTQ